MDKPSGKAERGDNHKSSGTIIQQGTSEKHIKYRFKCKFCEKATKIALKNGLNIDLGNILFVYLRDVKWNDLDKKSVKIDRNIMLFDYGS